MLTPIRRQNRYDWCRQHLRWTQRQWQIVMFTDESRFCINTNDGLAKVWRRRGKLYADCCVRECSRWGCGIVMVWGVISWCYRTPLVVIEGNSTSRRYIDEVLQPVVVQFLQKHADSNAVSTRQRQTSFSKTYNRLSWTKQCAGVTLANVLS